LQSLAIAGLLALVAIVIAGLVPGSEARLEHVGAGWIALAVVLELGACAAYAVLFHAVFSQGRYRLGRIRATQIAFGELGGFVVSPTGAAGPALRIWALLRGGMPFRVVMSRSVTHFAIFQIPYVVVAILLGAGVVLGLGVGHARTALALAPIALVIVVLALALAAGRVAGRPARSTARWRRIGREVVEAIPEGVRETPARLHEPRPLPASIGYWVGDCGVLIVAVHAVGGSAPVAVIALAYMLGLLGNALPLPGGVGGVEPAMLGVLTSSGVDLAVGAAAVVLYRFVSLGLQAALGVVAVATLIPSLQRERRDDAPDRAPVAAPDARAA
jgi:uncharacterized membrane protein YbhN (UPF0104 family)